MDTTTNLPTASEKNIKAKRTLKKTAQILFGIAIIGQLLFVYYIVSFYGGTAIAGETEKWNEELYNGLVEGDSIGNFALMVHLFLAAIITFGGPIQFMPYIRKNYPKFHRWNGRIYYVAAYLITFAGLYMIYTRTPIGGNLMRMGNSLNAILILTFSTLAWRAAIARDFTTHKKWAIRAFLMVSGVWFFRIGYGLWIVLTAGNMYGSTESINGPFDIFLAFAHSLIPLAIIELYFYARDKLGHFGKYVMTAFLGLLCVILPASIFMVAKAFWSLF